MTLEQAAATYRTAQSNSQKAQAAYTAGTNPPLVAILAAETLAKNNLLRVSREERQEA